MMNPVERFEQKFIPEPMSGCWLWTSGLFSNGYGQFSLNGSPVGAHRFSFETYVGPIGEGLYVCHKCDNRLCVNPEHLFLGTAQDNKLDCMAKGRVVQVRGEDQGSAKLTTEKVLAIRSLPTLPLALAKEYAAKWGVCWRTLYRVRQGVRWGHV